MSEERTRTRYLKRLAALEAERTTWSAHWKELDEQLCPGRGVFDSAEPNLGVKKYGKIINNTPPHALGVLAAGMMAGITSPSRPWFRLTTPDPTLAEFGPVRGWLDIVEERIRALFIRSNVYNILPSMYVDLGAFGTAVAILDEDFEDGLRGYVIPCGSYCLANSERMQVDTLFRKFKPTVLQMVRKFTLAKCSDRIQDQYTRGQLDQRTEVVQVIEPNDSQDGQLADYRGMAFRSCWFERSAIEGHEAFLRESGYRRFPVLAPRWDTTGDDTYGRGPGMRALGDAKALQLLEKRKTQMVDKIVTPPMKGPPALRNGRVSMLPGDITFVDETAAGAKFEPAMVVDARSVEFAEQSARQHEERINSTFYADLWLMLAQSDRRQITAREIDERHEEKMLQLGPVLERLKDELLDPLIDRAFDICLDRGDLPPPPEELAGIELSVDHISILAQAQRLLGTVAVERLSSFVGNLAAVFPSVVDKFDADQAVDEYASMLGVKSNLVVPDEKVEEIRAKRAEAQQKAAQAEQLNTAAEGAKTLSETDTGGQNALTTMLGGLGVGAPGGAQA